MIDTIYLDMDGVIVDLEYELQRLEGRTIAELRAENPDPDYDVVIELIKKHIDSEPFVNAPYMAGANIILNQWVPKWIAVGKKVLILSSGSKHDVIFSKCVDQKNQWLDNRGIKLDRLYAKGGRTKCLHATPTTFLLDDHGPNVQNFIGAGGYGFIHHTVGETEEYLTSIGLL